ncbi:MAG: hypothetical protein CMO49_04500 [Verrucomicrobiales bacterium]|jgi:hypothetical protein|nr:hypothetical protein [Verrucomicrobiales bacterium]MEC8659858.1 hypothetical protein [Verrucomicrobiota bacterium]|tara:strand:+ start:100 stop:645 length:546 start_codon:yes stop_codon:yes gene_type:complete
MQLDPNEPCPFLPKIDKKIKASDSRALSNQKGLSFYRLCLEYSQTKWMQGLPAQSLLQLNRAMSADLRGNEEYLKDYPIPYSSIKWILCQRTDKDGQFLGNPRRHWQHYATRMSGPRSEIRIWRSWACFAIASKVLPSSEFPEDKEQLLNEGLHLPSLSTIESNLKKLGFVGEVENWMQLL